MIKFRVHCWAVLAAAVLVASSASAQVKGPSSSATPYILPTAKNYKTTSLLTVTDTVARTGGGGTYSMVGIPDGLGAYDNNDGTFTLLMGHELGSSAGVTRDHGGKGAFVSEWIINKSTLAVVSGRDLIQSVKLDTGAAVTGTSLNINRFCSADLAKPSAFFEAVSGLGTNNRLFLNGEEAGSSGRAFATVATGTDKGTAYVLQSFGTASWENLIANPGTGVATLVAGTDDSTPSTPNSIGKVYMYLGTKTNSGTDIEKAGLTNGTQYAVVVNGVGLESRTNALGSSSPQFSGTFTLDTVANGTSFLRPEDGVWDPNNPNDFYFATTDRLDTHDAGGVQTGNSRLWKMHFNDLSNPTAGGTIEAVLRGIGSNGNDINQPNMIDNITFGENGLMILQEDPGNANHNARVFSYNPRTGALQQILGHDESRFGRVGLAATSPFTWDEESSGVIDVSSILGYQAWLIADQAHYTSGIPTYAVEGGQLLLVTVPEPSTWALLGLGGIGLVGVAARRRRLA